MAADAEGLAQSLSALEGLRRKYVVSTHSGSFTAEKYVVSTMARGLSLIKICIRGRPF
jgi:hypothetical protein